MTLRHFKIFIEVCKTKNMTAASKNLFMSQSAVSQAIAELENYYKVNIFERLSRKLYITTEGEKLLRYASIMVRINSDLENDMKSYREKGLIRIGASVTVSAYYLPGLVSNFKKLYPETEIIVFEDNTEKIESMLLNGDIDIGFVEGETISSDIVKKEYMDDELVLICGNNHRISKLKNVASKDIENEEFIIREQGSGTRKTFEDVMAENNLNFKVIWTCNNSDTIKMAVAEGLGVSVISKLAVEKDEKMGILTVKRIEGIEFKRKFKMVHHKNKYINSHLEKLMELCID